MDRALRNICFEAKKMIQELLQKLFEHTNQQDFYSASTIMEMLKYPTMQIIISLTEKAHNSVAIGAI